MKKEDRGISRRQFLGSSLAVVAMGLIPKKMFAQAKDTRTPQKKSATRVILLGTGGGPRANKKANQAALVILVNNVPYVVDCGCGVSRQLVFSDIPLRTIKSIFITHNHSDHNLEYGNLIYNAWVSGFKGRIDTYGPPPLEKMTKLFLEMNKYDIDIRIPDEGRPPLDPMVHVHEFTKGGLVMEDENVKVTAAVVNHPPVVPSFAYRFDTPGRSIVFSGDTTPCDSLIKLSQGADILIHEVIHKQSLARLMARIPNADRLVEHIVACHTTVEDVGKVAKACGVKKLVLTHFVPSDDLTLTDEMWRGPAAKEFNGEIVVGKDLLEI
ncbi:MAG: MBL fold metallo-hydrolase [Proteobacteria bacterium]|nr:MBL fold metallo-hydrolase [Pseudomonadota bacterium]